MNEGNEPIREPGSNVRIEVLEEREMPRGWRYRVRLESADSTTISEHEVTLSWVDHNYWCGGRLAPSKTIEAVLTYCIDHQSPPFPREFDAARARRWMPQIDKELRRAI